MPILVLTQSEVEQLLDMQGCMEAMADVLAALARGELFLPLRMIAFPPGENSGIGLMPSHRGGSAPAYALKTVCLFPDNAKRGLDPHQGTVTLFSGETGEVRALMNASAVTAIRTAAVSGVATRALAREDARTLAILGAGFQAAAHLDALRAIRDFERVVIWNRTPGRAASFDGVEEAPTAEEALRDADVVVTATAAAEPILRRAWLKEGAHVNAVGSSIPTARELDTATMVDCALFVDRRESAVNEAGDFVIAQREGALTADAIRGELGEVLIGAVEGRRSEQELTVFESLGLAVEDLAAAEHVLARAEAENAGMVVSL
jgi:ornithine cyclodeaminase